MSLKKAVEILERQRLKNDGNDACRNQITSIISLLDSPTFKNLWQLHSSIQDLARMSPRSQANLDISPQGTLAPRIDSHSEDISADANDRALQASVVSSLSAAPTQDDLHEAELHESIEKLAQGRHVETITLTKDPNTSLGFSVVKAKDQEGQPIGIFVQHIKPDSIADRDGRLEKDDQILAINDQILVDVSHEQAIRILQSAEQVQLVVARGGEGAASPTHRPDPPPAKHSESDMLNTEWTQIEIIELINDGTGLGFGIIGGRSTGVVVKTILPGGVADINGRLRSGDHILYINDVNVRGMSSEQVASVLRQSGSHVRLIIARCILEPPVKQDLSAPIIPTTQLDEQLANLFSSDSQEQLDYIGLSGSETTSPMGLPPSYHLGNVDVHNLQHEASSTSEYETFEVTLEKDNSGLGITIAGVIGGDGLRGEMCGIFVKGVTEDSPASRDGRIRINDHICEVDNRSLWGCTNQEAVEILRLTGHSVKLKLIRYFRGPKYDQLQIHQASQLTVVPKDARMMNHVPPAPSPVAGGEETHAPASTGPIFSVIDGIDDKDENDNEDFFNWSDEDYSGTLKSEVETTIKACWEPIIGDDFDVVVAQLSKFQESAGLGISLEGTVDIENGVEVRPHHYIRAILQHGPVGMNGKLKSGDELLEVNGKRILGLNHVNVVAILKKLPKNVRIVCARRKRSTSEIYASENSDDFSPSTFSMGVTPSHDRMVKSKSDMMLSGGDDMTTLNAENKVKSRSLEPLTGLAVWSPEPVVIELLKEDKGLGFSILDYKDPLNQSEVVIVIRSLVPGGVAQTDGRLIPGDRLMFVNDVDLENATLDQAVQALKGAPQGVVQIGVAKPLPISQSFHNQVNENEFGSDGYMYRDIAVTDQSDSTVPLVDVNTARRTPTRSLSSTNSDSDIEELKSRLKRERDGYFSSSSSDMDERGGPVIDSRSPDATNHLPHDTMTGDLQGYDPMYAPPIVPPPPPPLLHTNANVLAYPSTHDTGVVKDVTSVPPHQHAHALTHAPAHSNILTSSPTVKPALPPKPSYSVLQTIQATNKPGDIPSSYKHDTDTGYEKTTKMSPPVKPLRKRPPSMEAKKSPTVPPKPSYISLASKQEDIPPPLPKSSPPKPSPPLPKPTLPIDPDENPTAHHQPAERTDSWASSNSDNANTSDLRDTSPHSTPAVASPALSPLTPTRVARTLSGSSADSLPATFERTIKINKGSEQIGMTLEVVDKGVNGCLVKSVSAGGAIANSSEIKVGDYIVNLNYENMRRITSAQAHAVVRRASILSNTLLRITYISGEDVAAHRSSANSSPSHHQYPLMTSPNPSLSPVHRARSSPPASSPLASPARSATATSVASSLASPDDYKTSTISLTPPPLPDSAPPPLLAEQSAFSPPPPLPQTPAVTSSDAIAQPTRLKAYKEGPPAISEHAWGVPRQVELTRLTGQSLGISIVGGRVDMFHVSPDNVISGIFIKHVLPDSPAGENGTLKTGDRIIMVNGSDLTDATHDHAVEVIRNAANPVQFTVQSLIDAGCPRDREVEKVTESTAPPLSHPPTANKVDSLPDKALDNMPDPGEGSDDDVEADEYGYTLKKLQRKYGDLMGELHLIELEHGGNGLGISLAGNKDRSTMSTFIAGLQPDSAAELDGRLHIGDELLEVNGQTLYGRSHLNASAIIKSQVTPVIKLVLLRRDNGRDHMAVKPLRLSPSLPFEDSKSSPSREPAIPSLPPTPEHKPLPESYDNVTTVVLHKKSSASLGLAISEGNSDGKPGIFVQSLTPGGTAHKDGNLQVDDQILEVDDHSLIGVNYEKAISILRNTKGKVKLTISKYGDRSQGASVIDIDVPGESSTDVPSIVEPQEESSDPSNCKIIPGVETVIEIEKGRKGLGLSIVGGADTLLGAIIIHEVYEDGAAAKDGRLKQGDQILEVNNEDVRNVSHERAIQVLRQTPATVHMCVFRDDAQLRDEDLLDVFSIELIKKPGKGLGISIVGKRSDVGVFISDIVKGGLAEADGRLMQGDQILSVNDTDLRQASQDEAAVLLKTLMGKVSMTIGRLKAGSKASSVRTTGGVGGTAVHKSNSSASSKARSKHSKKFHNDARNNTIRTVKLERDGAGSLGLSIAGGEGSPMGDVPVVIADINPEGPAARCAKLKVGDYILSIDGVLTDGMSHNEAVLMLKNSSANVTLKVVHGKELTVNVNNGTARQTSMDLTPVPIGPIDVDYNTEAVRTIVLQKGSEGLGFTIVGGHGSPHGDLPIYVKNVFSKGAAADGNELKRGDQILSVCGTSLEGLTHEEAVNILKQTRGEVTLQIIS